MPGLSYIVPQDGSQRILTFDSIDQEQHESIAEVTEHPVENGSNVSDHVRPGNDILGLVATVTNTPIEADTLRFRGEVKSALVQVPRYEMPFAPTPGFVTRSVAQLGDRTGPVGITVLTFSTPFDAIRERYEELRELLRNGALFDVVTPLREYTDCVFTRVSAPRMAGNGSVEFGLEIREVKIVSTGAVAAPPVPVEPRGAPAKNKGGQASQPPPVNVQKLASDLVQGFDALVNFAGGP